MSTWTWNKRAIEHLRERFHISLRGLVPDDRLAEALDMVVEDVKVVAMTQVHIVVTGGPPNASDR